MLKPDTLGLIFENPNKGGRSEKFVKETESIFNSSNPPDLLIVARNQFLW
jgi:hypothetical protein